MTTEKHRNRAKRPQNRERTQERGSQFREPCGAIPSRCKDSSPHERSWNAVCVMSPEGWHEHGPCKTLPSAIIPG